MVDMPLLYAEKYLIFLGVLKLSVNTDSSERVRECSLEVVQLSIPSSTIYT